MVTKVSDVGWGSYKSYSGPFFRGQRKFDFSRVNQGSDDSTKWMCVLAATESGSYDAVNMYDSCIMTLGMIQFCDARMFGTCNLLAACERKVPGIIAPVNSYAAQVGYRFDVAAGRFYTTQGQLVETVDQQRKLYLRDSDGSTWPSEETRLYAKGWAAAMANVWDTQEARDAQTVYTGGRLPSFAMASVRDTLFKGPTNKWIDTARAAYISFAANNPEQAWKQYTTIGAPSGDPQTWLVKLLRQLTFGPGFGIYPTRYNAIRPQLERLYDVDLPDTASLLQASGPSVAPQPSRHWTVVEVQNALLGAGYDLGPYGADGVMGAKTTAALKAFQQSKGLVADGILGPKTEAALDKLQGS